MSRRKAMTVFLAAMVIFGTIGVFRKEIDMSSGMLCLVRGAVGTVFLAVVSLFRRKKPDWATLGRHWWKLCLSGALIGFNWILLFEAYNHTTVSVATLCYYMAPMFVILLARPVLGESLTLRRLICVAVAVVGMIPVSGFGTDGGKTDVMGPVLALAAAAMYAAVVLINKKTPPIDAFHQTVVQLGTAAVVLVPYVFITGEWKLSAMSPNAWVLALVMGVVHTGLVYAMYFGAMPYISAQTAAMFSFADPVTAILLSECVARFWPGAADKPMSLFGWIGAIMILGAAILAEFKPKRKIPQSSKS